MPVILLADDDPMQHELVQATLGRAHRVLQAWNGREALALARRERPDLVLLDVGMPELDGFEVCRQLRDDPATRAIEVVMLSARADGSDRRRGVEVGASVYITKPFSPSALLDTVRRALGDRDLAQPLPAPLPAEPEPVGERPADLVQTLAYARELSALYEAAQERLNALLAIHEAGRVLSSTLEADAIGRHLLSAVGRVAGLDAAVLRLRNRSQQARVEHAVGPDWLWRWAESTPASRAARRSALATGEPQSFGLGHPPGGTTPLVGWCLPLRAQDRVLGLLEAYGPEGQAAANTAEFLGSLASQAASALDNARLYRELAEREQQLADLVGRLLVAQEEERRRIAYNLHDDLAQLAAGIHQRLQAFAYEYAPEAPRAREQLEQTVELARRMVGQTRGVIADLRPTTLDDFGLATALRLPVEALRAEGWEVSYEETLGAERLPPAVETALFRVAQEALANARKHAGATRVHLALQREERGVRLVVQDWGRGFRVATARVGARPGERVGLLGMQERIALLGGRCVVRSRPGAGTAVVAEVPLAPGT